MGGEGSGRKPNPENMFKKSSPYPAVTDTGLTFPPTAHIKEEALTRDPTDISGSGSALEVQSNGTTTDDAVEILDFSNEFSLSESPAHDIDVSLNLGNIDHDSLLNFSANEHRVWENSIAQNIHADNITSASVTQHEGDINHDNLTGFVANEHIDHTSVTLTAGNGLSGGGDISANRSFAIDLNELGTETNIASGDFLPMVDITDNGSQKITFSNLESTIDAANISNGVTPSSTTTFTNKTFDANGTGNSLSNVDVADLADGTDGELITWDSTGSPSTVAVGTSGQLLTSNGAGSAPTFQDASGGSATKEFFISPSHENGVTYDPSDAGTHVGTQLVDGEDQFFEFFVPNDFSSITDAVVVVIPDSTETIQWDTDVNFGASGEDFNNHTDSETNQTLAVTDNKISELDVSASLSGIAAGDYVGFRFVSNTTQLHVIGFRFKYS